jgi:hypothetical protein
MTLKSMLSATLGTPTGGGDFAKRRRAQDRQQVTAKRQQQSAARRQRERGKLGAVRQQERTRADARVAKARRNPARRPARPAHDYRRCRDRDCERGPCTAWRDGIEYGLELAAAAEARS